MKKYLKLFLIAFVAFIISLVIQTPAKIVLDLVITDEVLQQQKLEVHGVEGSIWSGSISQIVHKGITIGKLSWNVTFSPILNGAFGGKVLLENKDGYVDAEVMVNSSADIIARSISGKLNAGFITTVATRFPVVADGDVIIDVSEIVIESMKPTKAEGRVVWTNAAIIMVESISLGNINANLTTNEDGTIKVDLGDGGKVLNLKSTLNLKPDGNYQFKGTVSARRPAERSLLNAMRMMGSRNGSTVNLNYSGKI